MMDDAPQMKHVAATYLTSGFGTSLYLDAKSTIFNHFAKAHQGLSRCDCDASKEMYDVLS